MTHGPLTESSLSHSLRTHIGKGREGKGIGREGKGSISGYVKCQSLLSQRARALSD